MRVKTEDRRQAIVAAARDVFQELGFDRASMDIISRRLGGSKSTLYGYFRSKEALYETAMRTGRDISDGTKALRRGSKTASGDSGLPVQSRQGAGSIGAKARISTADRRQEIVDGALEVFRELGFERASMAIIARRLHRSKGSLYGFFPSKTELFEAAMEAGGQKPGDKVMGLLNASADDLRKVLIPFAKAYVKFIVDKEVLALTRTAIAEGPNSPVGKRLFKAGPGKAISMMTAFFAEMIKQGKLRDVSPKTAAIHFKGLLEAGYFEESLLGARTLPEKASAEAVDIFLRAYAT